MKVQILIRQLSVTELQMLCVLKHFAIRMHERGISQTGFISSWKPNLRSGFELCENSAILSKQCQNMGTIMSH